MLEPSIEEAAVSRRALDQEDETTRPVGPCAILGGAVMAALALLAAAGIAAGVHLHRVVADASVPRAG